MNSVFIATSIDGYIADRDGKIDWLHSLPNPEGIDMGYAAFMSRIDAIVMGRTTFDVVKSFGIDWPFKIPVFVLSNSMKEVPAGFEDKITLMKGEVSYVLASVNKMGYNKLYIDGGKVIQAFLKAGLIDEMIITTIPVLLGGGTSLFGEMNELQNFKCILSERFLDAVVQNHFVKVG